MYLIIDALEIYRLYNYKMTLSIISNEAGPVTTIIPPHIMVEGEPLMDALSLSL